MEAQGGGSIINVSSTASLKWGPAEYISYQSSKAALNHFSRIVARQYAGKQIRCNVVVPGMIDTPHVRTLYRDKTAAELEQIMRDRGRVVPDGAAGHEPGHRQRRALLASDESSYVTGLLLVVDGGRTL
jgi:NAD(P)-dependent dehydrogenase (short-subunit alcohol dehydrogenase family)